ncbi:MAG: GFA family protein [Gammaproteobacteria bacterium]|nr:GFA family protein [Gammaproteobacteria bacterium]
MIEGGCFCGNIRFTIAEKPQGDYLVANCHCSMCRKTSAAPFVTYLVIPKAAFQYKTGTPKILQSSDKSSRQFCPDCGTHLLFATTDRPNNFDITTGSLDEPNRFTPTVNVHEESKLTWLHLQ